MPDTPELVRRTRWPDGARRALVTPLQPSVVYRSDSPDALDAQYEGATSGYTYAREGHPNADVLAQKIDGLEGVAGGLITGSGMAAFRRSFWACWQRGITWWRVISFMGAACGS